MNHATRLATRDDDIDTLVDTLLAQPERAADIKTILRRKMAADGRAKSGPFLTLVPVRADDADDMWDNVPV